MAVGEIIGAAIGILMLIIVAYLVVGSTLSTAELVVNTQKDVTLQNEARLRTSISISDVAFTNQNEPNQPPPVKLSFQLKNTGNEPIRDFSHMDVYVSLSSSAPSFYRFDAAEVPGAGDAMSHTWAYTQIRPDNIHPGMLDPEEKMYIEIENFDLDSVPTEGYTISISTSNGVSDEYSA